VTTIRILPGEQVNWITPGPGYELARMHPGTDGHPELFELRLGPDHHEPQHAHGEDEILYITGGTFLFGSAVLGPGSSVLIPKNTLYQFRTGPDGGSFLNFRPRRAEVITKEQYRRGRDQSDLDGD
jgi:hypothetical protein